MSQEPPTSLTPYRSGAEPPARASERELVASPDRYRVRTKREFRMGQLGEFTGAVAIVGTLVLLFSNAVISASLAGLLAVVFVYAPLIARLVMRRRRAVALVRAIDDATVLFQSGRVEDAAREYDALADGARGLPFWHALLVFNRGAAHLRGGEIERALELFSVVERSGWFDDDRFPCYPLLMAGQGTAHVILGALDEAERKQREGHARASAARKNVLLVLDAMVLARRGRFREAAAEIELRAPESEGMLNAAQQRSLQVLRAFSLTQVSGDGAAVARAVEVAKSGRAGEHEYLAVRWPELRAFLTAHGFSTRAG